MCGSLCSSCLLLQGASCPFLSYHLIDSIIISSQSTSYQHAFTAVCNLCFRPDNGLFACLFFLPTLIAGLIKDIASPHKPQLSTLHTCSSGEVSKEIASSLGFHCETKMYPSAMSQNRACIAGGGCRALGSFLFMGVSGPGAGCQPLVGRWLWSHLHGSCKTLPGFSP